MEPPTVRVMRTENKVHLRQSRPQNLTFGLNFYFHPSWLCELGQIT